MTERLGGVYLRAAPLMMATGDAFEGELLAAIGVENDAAAYTGWEYPADQAVNLYPDIIFYDEGIDPEYFKGTQVYNTTDAYKQGRIYPVNGTALERQSGRMFAELEKMFAEAYPELASLLDAPPEEEPAAEVDFSRENMKTWMNSIIWLPSSMSWMIMIITIFRRQCRSVIIQAALKM